MSLVRWGCFSWRTSYGVNFRSSDNAVANALPLFNSIISLEIRTKIHENHPRPHNDLVSQNSGIIEVPPVFGVSMHAHAAHNDKCRDSR
jgi:hypothetical protein